MRRSPKIRTIAAILGFAMLLTAASGCGEDGGDGSIGEQDAARLRSLLDEIAANVENESCDEATAAAGSFEVEVTNLTNVPDDIVNDLLAASESLQSLVIQECGTGDTTSSTTSTSSREKTSTTTSTETTTVPTTTTETTSTTTTTTTDTETDDETDDDDTGGTSGGGGIEAPGGGAAEEAD